MRPSFSLNISSNKNISIIIACLLIASRMNSLIINVTASSNRGFGVPSSKTSDESASINSRQSDLDVEPALEDMTERELIELIVNELADEEENESPSPSVGDSRRGFGLPQSSTTSTANNNVSEGIESDLNDADGDNRVDSQKNLSDESLVQSIMKSLDDKENAPRLASALYAASSDTEDMSANNPDNVKDLMLDLQKMIAGANAPEALKDSLKDDGDKKRSASQKNRGSATTMNSRVSTMELYKKADEDGSRDTPKINFDRDKNNAGGVSASHQLYASRKIASQDNAMQSNDIDSIEDKFVMLLLSDEGLSSLIDLLISTLEARRLKGASSSNSKGVDKMLQKARIAYQMLQDDISVIQNDEEADTVSASDKKMSRVTLPGMGDIFFNEDGIPFVKTD